MFVASNPIPRQVFPANNNEARSVLKIQARNQDRLLDVPHNDILRKGFSSEEAGFSPEEKVFEMESKVFEDQNSAAVLKDARKKTALLRYNFSCIK